MCRIELADSRPAELRLGRTAWGALLAALLAGCVQKMSDQPRYEPLEASTFFADGMASRPLVPGTVARGQLRTDEHFFTGRVDGELADRLPDRSLAERSLEELLLRGRERFNIFCSPCHDRVGTGQGMVVRRGFPQPPSYHSDRLRQAPIGYFFDVATNGFGRMPSYAVRVPTDDRWAIAAYIRALQKSQHAEVDSLPEEDREKLQQVTE
jgi:hypothetical protein